MVGIRLKASALALVGVLSVVSGCSSSSKSTATTRGPTSTAATSSTVASTASSEIATTETVASTTTVVASTTPSTGTSSTPNIAAPTSTGAPTPPSVVATSPAGPANLCDLLSNGEANAFTGVTMVQDANDGASCVYDGTDSSRVYIERTAGQTTANLPAGEAAVAGLGDAAVSSDQAIDVLVGSTLFTIGTYPTFPADKFLALAKTVIAHVTG